MKDIKETAKKLNEVPRCWVKNGEDDYFLHDNNNICLPVLAYKFSCVLRKLNIEFSEYNVRMKHEKKKFCCYYDKNCYEQRKEVLPTYEFSKKDRLYHYIGKHEGMVPTDETIKAAQKLVEKVNEEMDVFLFERDINILKQIMKGKDFLFTNCNEIGTSVRERTIGNYYVFNVKRNNGIENGDMVIFDMNKVKGKNIEIELPDIKKERKELLLGENNCNVQKWADDCGIKEIKVFI